MITILRNSTDQSSYQNKCSKCGKPAYCKGLCKQCYNAVYYASKNTRVKGQWARKYDKCIRCGSTEYRHIGHGLCLACYIKTKYKTKVEYQPRIKWARNYDQCIRCGTAEVKHRSSGLCLTCYACTKRFPENYKNNEQTQPLLDIGGLQQNAI